MFVNQAPFFKLIRKSMMLALAISLLFATIVYAASGDVDSGFYSSQVAAGESGDTPRSLVGLQTDQKIILAGRVCTVTCDIILSRFHTDGTPDATFSGDGVQTTDLGAREDVYGLAIQSDDKIVVSGSTCDSLRGPRCRLFVVRYTPDGELDPTFNTDGIFTLANKVTNSRQSYNEGGLAIRPNGKIVVAGILETKQYTYPAIVVQLKTNGSLDGNFGTKGIAYIGVSRFWSSDLAIQPDGKIVIVGEKSTLSGIINTMIVRMAANGSKLNTAFGVQGKRVTDFGGDDHATSVALGAEGKIVVTVWSHDNGFENFRVGRYNSNGSLDTTFNGSGMVTTNITPDADNSAYDALIQSDGKIVAVGYTNPVGSTRDIALVRYNADGSLDTSFSGDGLFTLSYYSQDYGYSIAKQSDGKYVVASSSLNITGTSDPRYLILTRVLP